MRLQIRANANDVFVKTFWIFTAFMWIVLGVILNGGTTEYEQVVFTFLVFCFTVVSIVCLEFRHENPIKSSEERV